MSCSRTKPSDAGDPCENVDDTIMRQSFVTSAPQPLSRAGDSWANVLCFYFFIVPIVQWKYQIWGFNILGQTWQCNVITDCGGEMSWFYFTSWLL